MPVNVSVTKYSRHLRLDNIMKIQLYLLALCAAFFALHSLHNRHVDTNRAL